MDTLIRVCAIILIGPPITETTHKNASELVPKPESLQSGPFMIYSPSVSTFNQQLWLTAKIKTDFGESKFWFDYCFDWFLFSFAAIAQPSIHCKLLFGDNILKSHFIYDVPKADINSML